jgi:hypothetical protein
MRVTQITYGKSKKLRDGTFEFLILKADLDLIEDDFPGSSVLVMPIINQKQKIDKIVSV